MIGQLDQYGPPLPGGKEVNPLKIALYFNELKEAGMGKSEAVHYMAKYCRKAPWGILWL